MVASRVLPARDACGTCGARVVSPPATGKAAARSPDARRARVSRLGAAAAASLARCDDNACRPSPTKAFAGFLTIG